MSQSDIPGIGFTWTGDAMMPRYPKIADRHYCIGEMYLLVSMQQRSMNSHSHFFASLHEAWSNLPEHLAERFPTAEHLRAYALIKAGFSDSASIVCSSKAEATRVAAFIRPVDEFSIVVVSEYTVTRYTAKSQSMRAMGKQDFQKSKQAVLDIISSMIDVSSNQLAAEAGQSA